MTSLPSKVKTLLLAFAAALCLQPVPAHAQTPAPQAAKWERYKFPGDEFSVELPGMPYVFHTFRQISLRESEKTRVFGLYADNVVFMIVAFDKPRALESLANFVDYVRFGNSSTVDAQRAVTAGGFEGSEFRNVTRLHAPPTAKTELLLPPDAAPAAPPPDGPAARQVFETLRVFKTKSHAYLVKTMSQTERHPLAERFLDSLTLLDNPRGREIVEAAAPAPSVVAPPSVNVAPAPVKAAPTPATTGTGRGLGPGRGDRPGPSGGGLGPGAGPVDYNRVFQPKDVTSKAIIVYKGDPGFSEEARQNNVTGVVRLRAVLNATGRVTNVGVVKGLPDGLTERAVYAARHLLFFPARKDGRDVGQYITLEYNFNIY